MTFDLISGLDMQIQTWHPPLRLCIHAKYYVKIGLTNVPKNANKTKNMHLFSIPIANYYTTCRYLDDILNIDNIKFDNTLQSSNSIKPRPLIPKPCFWTCICPFLMILFIPKFTINVTILILKLSISHI